MGVGGTASSAPVVDWPQFARTPNHAGNELDGSGITRESVHTLHVSWSGKMGGGASSSSPVIAGGIVYVGGTNGRLSAFNLAGCLDAFGVCDPLWQGKTRNGIYGAPAVVGDTVLVASADHFLYAFPAFGCDFAPICEPMWRGRLGSASLASVAVAGATAYVSNYNGRVLAFPVAGCGTPVCEPRWRGEITGHSSSSPAVGNGLVFIDSYRGNHGWLYAFSTAGCDGADACAPVWRASLGGPAFATPTVAGGYVYTGTAAGEVDVFDANGCASGECTPLWRARTGDTYTQGAPAVRGDTMYVTAQGSPDPNRVGVVESFPAGGCGAEVCDPVWTGVNGASGFESAPVVVGNVVLVAKGPASGVPVDAGVYAFPVNGCGAITCDPIHFAQVGTGQNYLGSSVAVAAGRVAFASFDNVTNRSLLYVLET